MKFKIGDRVKLISSNWGDTSVNPRWGGAHGKIGGTIVLYEGKCLETRVKWDNGEKNSYDFSDLQLIKEATMDLRARIEAVTGWDKSADDLLQEVNKREIGGPTYRFVIDEAENCGYVAIVEHGSFLTITDEKVKESFRFDTQCEKLEAFKKALLWLAEKSGKLEDDFKVGDYVVGLSNSYFRNYNMGNRVGDIFRIHKYTGKFVYIDKKRPQANCFKSDIRKATEREIEHYLDKNKGEFKEEIAELREKLERLEEKL